MNPLEQSARAAARIRQRIVRMHRRGSNVGSAMSVADILAVLYRDVMHIDRVDDPKRDRFILSKGHAAAALYAVFVEKGWLSEGDLDGFLTDGVLMGHPCRHALPGVEFSTGSLGHGLAVAVGIALAARRSGKSFRIFTLMGDGELQEGSVWEAALLASAWNLGSLVAIVDVNCWQGYDAVDTISPRERFAQRWESCGWSAEWVDGHDCGALRTALARQSDRPQAILARTRLGKGVKEMEDDLGWHYYNVSSEQLPRFLSELGGGGV